MSFDRNVEDSLEHCIFHLYNIISIAISLVHSIHFTAIEFWRHTNRFRQTKTNFADRKICDSVQMPMHQFNDKLSEKQNA